MSIIVTYRDIATDITGSFGRQFIARMLAEYNVPVRKGTARGVAIGMKRQKYAAAIILAVYDLDSADVARVAGIPVRLVSKWRTEKLFQTVEDHLRRACCNEVLSCGTNPENIDMFVDVSLFSPLLKEYLLAVCDTMAAEADMRLFYLWPIVRRICGGR